MQFFLNYVKQWNQLSSSGNQRLEWIQSRPTNSAAILTNYEKESQPDNTSNANPDDPEDDEERRGAANVRERRRMCGINVAFIVSVYSQPNTYPS